jgi:putative ABC transport system permease protein
MRIGSGAGARVIRGGYLSSRASFPFYLAIKELWHNRGRFILLSLVISLITLLVLFIAALGEGLANGNREYIANLDATLIIYREKSDYIIGASQLDAATLRAVRRVVGQRNAGPIYVSTTDVISAVEPIKVSLLAADPGYPGMPLLLSGRHFRPGTADEVVVDRRLASRASLRIGDTIRIRSTQGPKDRFSDLRVVGTVGGQSYLFQPSILVSPSTWEKVRPQTEADSRDPTPYPNVIAVRLAQTQSLTVARRDLVSAVARIEAADLETAINSIPGYAAQQTTIQTQGFFTLLIGVLVIGGFFQIQVLQKVPQIGVLKAIGSSNFAVGAAAVIQIVIITILGVLTGTAVTFLFSQGFPPTIPIVFNGLSVAYSIGALVLIGPVGGLVSVVYAVRIEPLRALRLQ